jgi:hypothetical protein
MATTVNAEAWIPSTVGDTLTGEVVHIDLVRDHPSAPPDGILIVHVRGDDGVTRAAWAWHKVLDSQYRRHRPNIGERISITYQGKAQPKGDGKPYHSYLVEVEGREPEPFSWDRVAAPRGDDPTPPLAAAAQAPDPFTPATSGDDDIPF